VLSHRRGEQEERSSARLMIPADKRFNWSHEDLAQSEHHPREYNENTDYVHPTLSHFDSEDTFAVGSRQ
jgi:hypothetical protein